MLINNTVVVIYLGVLVGGVLFALFGVTSEILRHDYFADGKNGR